MTRFQFERKSIIKVTIELDSNGYDSYSVLGQMPSGHEIRFQTNLAISPSIPELIENINQQIIEMKGSDYAQFISWKSHS